MHSLVGYTGFVGSNLAAKHPFDGLYNSRNVSSAFGTRPDLLVYAGVPAEMYLANTDPAADLAVIENAAENIRRIEPKALALISTIAVLDDPVGAYEDCPVDPSRLTAYGRHRHRLEWLARGIVDDCHVLRLPALFGRGIKKNFIYDIMHHFPARLDAGRFGEFAAREPAVADCYRPEASGFFRLDAPPGREGDLREAFRRLGFSAASFTDSRSVFQFYNLEHLWEHTGIAIRNGVGTLHLAVEKLSAAEVYAELTGGEFVNETAARPFHYDFRTRHDSLFGGSGGYIFDRRRVIGELKEFAGRAG
ncbi:MAG: NAD(P)-dependent oxidoreductase [Deltaproteobacteria bacterium]|jgi:hypothetical protein|nr:NAD(P)-dependent oxidoreductase [Deltaproteobacteria bacterium]